MAYQHLTWGALKTLAHKRVGAAAFYTETEMGLYLVEAFRIWNLLTGHFRQSKAVTTVTSQLFYDTTLHLQTVTEQNVMNEMQYHTLETANNGASLVSDMWTVGEWVDYINARMANFTAETKLVLSRESAFSSVINQTQYDLGTSVSTDLLEVHRVAWLDASGNSHGLREDSTLTYDRLLPTWTVSSASQEPEVYVRAGRPQLKIEILPAPVASGTIDILYTKRPTQLPQTVDTTAWEIPYSQKKDKRMTLPKPSIVKPVTKKASSLPGLSSSDKCKAESNSGAYLLTSRRSSQWTWARMAGKQTIPHRRYGFQWVSRRWRLTPRTTPVQEPSTVTA